MIRIRDLHKSFGKNHVLRGLNLDIEKGRITVIIGGSGSGKSVLLKHLIKLMEPDSGTIEFDGQVLGRMNSRELLNFRRQFGMLFQESALFDSMTVEENIAFPMREHTRWSKAEIRARVREKLDMVGLGEVEDRLPSELSGGMRKRVGLARAIAIDPQYILYDEPTTGLDPIMTRSINRLILDTNAKLGTTSIVISHDIKGALKMADRIIMLHYGDILAAGTPQEILESDNETIQSFIAYDVKGEL
ncbi:ABC transporter ATP-binding protein [Desulfurispirillum indicum]|uniref:ABC transporter related protein n=1 Tax=Desulfurispirillum indicum (strain ATCC BAA-1389 / DSM 22839 / S5) TaxID=653733 RepID=E6W1R3_DESIS|nr:ABC transporter ATP-binding protein [Desulfurispirillum indicum]ADU65445.1 ABC transporter related protein [Desulfurispirillum indicum S5]UCZ57363.1 ABC transporter ATP-binding protein [Desulfurispirillum indicum]